MSFLSRLLVAFGFLLLSHAGYSAHEHTTLYGSIASLPLDITIETLVATVLITTGLVLSADQLRPISWSVWAGEIEKRGGAENPFRGLEDRVGFWDIRAKRKDYADWMRGKDVVALKE